MMEEDYEWTPPSEAEMKIIHARSERSDQISKRMGDYLLKGYKMLGSTCPECTTILLQDRQGTNYCIACKELDSDADKDDPVTNQEAARTQMLERTGTADITHADDLSYLLPQQPSPTVVTTATSDNPVSMPTISSSQVPNSATTFINIGEPIDSLCQKLHWATEELKQCTNLDVCIKLCQLIKACAEAIQSLKSIP